MINFSKNSGIFQNAILLAFAAISGCLSLYTMYSNVSSGFGYFAIFLLCLIFINIDKFENFKASASGVEARLKNTIKEAEISINGLNNLAIALASGYVTMLARSKSLLMLNLKESNAYKDQIEESLTELNLGDRLRDCFDIWDKHMLTLYVNQIFTITAEEEKLLPKKDILECVEVKAGGPHILQILPKKLEILKKYNLLTERRKDLLEDYDYYAKNFKHRRPDVFFK